MGKVIIHDRNREIIREKPAAASSSILEGMLLQKTVGADTWSKHSTAGGTAEPIFALEDRFGNADSEVTAYADGENVAAVIRPRMVDAWLKDGEVVVEGDALQSAGDGTLRKYVMNDGTKRSLIAGGTAGDRTVTGIATADRLASVLHFTTGGAVADLTAEFSITAANTINNDGGTDTSSDQLLVIWEDANGAGEGSIVGYADEAQSPSGANVRIKVRVA